MPKEDGYFKPGNPGRPVGSRSAETLFRDAIEKIATDQKIEDVERDLVITLLAKAKKGDLKALDMYLDRLYGKPKQSTDLTSGGKPIPIIDIHALQPNIGNKEDSKAK